MQTNQVRSNMQGMGNSPVITKEMVLEMAHAYYEWLIADDVPMDDNGAITGSSDEPQYPPN